MTFQVSGCYLKSDFAQVVGASRYRSNKLRVALFVVRQAPGRDAKETSLINVKRIAY